MKKDNTTTKDKEKKSRYRIQRQKNLADDIAGYCVMIALLSAIFLILAIPFMIENAFKIENKQETMIFLKIMIGCGASLITSLVGLAFCTKKITKIHEQYPELCNNSGGG